MKLTGKYTQDDDFVTIFSEEIKGVWGNGTQRKQRFTAAALAVYA